MHTDFINNISLHSIGKQLRIKHGELVGKSAIFLRNKIVKMVRDCPEIDLTSVFCQENIFFMKINYLVQYQLFKMYLFNTSAALGRKVTLNCKDLSKVCK